jgi:hypothetical protein
MKPTPYDAWILARLLSGQSLNGDGLAAMSETFRPLADRLATMPSEDRPEVWNGFLIGQADREEIIGAVADQDPKGPAPAIEAIPSGEDWPPLRLEGLSPVEPFPTDVLPVAAARLVVEGAEAIGCPPDFLGVPVLAVAGGTIGRSVNLLVKPGYFAGATIYAATIGPPSDGKTPALKAVASALRAIDDVLAAEHAQALERWKQDAAGLAKGIKPPPPPKPRRIDIDDFTMEVLPLLLADNPRGLIMVRDELTAFVLGMNQYKGGKGNDRSNALKIWSGDRIIKDRVTHDNHEPIRCPHPALSIIGGLTPDMLRELADPKGRADGFVDRFLLAYPDPLPIAQWSERGISEDVTGDWRELIARLWMRLLDFKEGRSVPHVAFFSTDGKRRWEEQYNAHVAEMNAEDFPPALRGPWGKFREYAGRLTLNLTLMHHAADPTADPLMVPDVGPRRVDDAWRVVGYFKSHARRIHPCLAFRPGVGGGRVPDAIVAWIRTGHRLSFTEHELRQARRWIGEKELAEALDYLTSRSAIRPHETPRDHARGGRPSSSTYEVNPTLLVS